LRGTGWKKKDPKAAVSEAVQPIVYYLDRGAPEPNSLGAAPGRAVVESGV